APLPQPAATGDSGDIVDWAVGATPRYSRPRRPAPRGGSGALLGMLLTLLIVSGTAYWLYRRTQSPVQVQVAGSASQPAAGRPVGPTPARIADASQPPPSMFDAAEARRQAATRPAATRAAAQRGSGSP